MSEKQCNFMDACNSFFVNFANKTNLSIIEALMNKPLNVGEITKKINKEQSTVSHNLKKLSACHILNFEQAGKERIYSLNKDLVVPILKIVGEHARKNCTNGCCR